MNLEDVGFAVLTLVLLVLAVSWFVIVGSVALEMLT